MNKFDPEKINKKDWWETRQAKTVACWFLGLIFLILIGNFLARITQDRPEQSYQLTSMNSFTLQLMLRHKTQPYTLIMLYDHDCGSCGKFIQELSVNKAEMNSAGINVVVISMADTPQEVGLYLHQNQVPIDFMSYIVSQSERQELRNQFYHFGNREILRYPHAMLLNRQNRIIQEYRNVTPANTIIEAVKAAEYPQQ